MPEAGSTDEQALLTDASHNHSSAPSLMQVNLTQVFLADASTADDPSAKRTGEWHNISEKHARPVQRGWLSTLRKQERPPDMLNNKRVIFSSGIAPERDESKSDPRRFRRTIRGKVGRTLPSWLKPNLNPKYVLNICPGFSHWPSIIYVRFRGAESPL